MLEWASQIQGYHFPRKINIEHARIQPNNHVYQILICNAITVCPNRAATQSLDPLDYVGQDVETRARCNHIYAQHCQLLLPSTLDVAQKQAHGLN